MNILITQSQLFNYSGSEMLTLEVAEEFTRLGHSVSVVTAVYDDPIKSDQANLDHIKIYHDNEIDNLELSIFDILWVHHSYVPEKILLNLIELRKHRKGPFVVYNHMSYVAPLEIPLSYQIESNIADMVLFNAPEIKKELFDSGFKFDGIKTDLLNNAAPSNFWKDSSVENAVNKILLVSNHPPNEVLDALEVLKNDGYEVNIFGRVQKGRVKRVEPVDIENAGIVVSIGKTVQYCLAAKTAVYCYDYFGGPGFLNNKNFSDARYFNFSGRGFKVKSSEQIVSEIKRYNLNKKDEQNKIVASLKDDFNLAVRLEDIIKYAEGVVKKIVSVDMVDINQYVSEQKLRIELLRKLHQTSVSQQAYKKRNEELKLIVNEVDADGIGLLAQLKKVQVEISTIKKSKTFMLSAQVRRLLNWKK